MHRREFLKIGSSALIGGMALPCIQAREPAKENDNQVVKPRASDKLLVNPGMGFPSSIPTVT